MISYRDPGDQCPFDEHSGDPDIQISRSDGLLYPEFIPESRLPGGGGKPGGASSLFLNEPGYYRLMFRKTSCTLVISIC